jgi:hypothetical protein
MDFTSIVLLIRCVTVYALPVYCPIYKRRLVGILIEILTVEMHMSMRLSFGSGYHFIPYRCTYSKR